MARKTPQDKKTKGKKLKSALKKPSQRNTRRKAKKTKHVSWSSDVPADEVPEPVVQPGVAAQLQLFFAALPVNERSPQARRQMDDRPPAARISAVPCSPTEVAADAMRHARSRSDGARGSRASAARLAISRQLSTGDSELVAIHLHDFLLLESCHGTAAMRTSPSICYVVIFVSFVSVFSKFYVVNSNRISYIVILVRV
ncbi:hypothetical protein L596_012800 [Steinernema carpocapsae]|uniref:Uncharacterized protein n=1 Tax=Steinernema carpocapsae TaxID=34508 RepID=A0A4U5NYY9_STECR|nr:hypothetical protein L596_012800 [Steinernema carpocapsae]